METKKKIISYPGMEKEDKASKFHQLVEYLAGLKEEKFTGYIKINFSQGHIGRAEKFEEILRRK